jgi:membrane protein required for colicin V production
MNTLDIILAAILLFGLVRGFMKGLFVELATLVALLLGVYGAIHFSYLISDFLVEKVSWDQQYINYCFCAHVYRHRHRHLLIGESTYKAR